ncbi:Beclin-2 [Sciurus carolinensis]|uniref:Beclin-2 n=1 Tax=Sciurus carolinensis TaxID=30640 RepID=A0AA41MQZ9_SCICA|nr:Beclin-2 [Sciurus carolinensis]
MSRMSSFRFMCQKCKQPLKGGESMEMSSSAQGGPGEGQEGGAHSMEKRDGGKLQVSVSKPFPDSGGMSEQRAKDFTLLGKVVSMRTLGSIQKTTVETFDILSGQKEMDLPLCEECTDSFLKQLDTQIALTELDSQSYRRCLETQMLTGEDKREALQMELQGLELEEARLARELEDVEENHARTAADLRAAQAETVELQQQERRYQRDFDELKWQQQELFDQLTSVENQLWYAQVQLDQLKKTDIFNATFEIREEGPLGIINNFRLGRLPGVPVGWNEINTAWGQTALLLLALSNAIGLQFQRYQLVACGNHSYLKSLTGDGAELPLFSDGSENVFWNNTFDRAIMAFLDCLQQFEEEAEKQEGDLCLPYRILVKEGRMEGPAGSGECYSVRTHLNTEEQWTKALRLMLLNLKRSLSWASSRYCQN